MTEWKTFLSRLAGRIWFRLALFTLVAIAFALVAGLVGPLLPSAISVNLGQDSVSTILQVLATSMLAVTTFSLTAMISAYASAAAVGTPRATQLLIADGTSQNALASFLGSFVFSIVGIVALSTGYYDDRGKTILFFGTLAVIAIIVVTLMQWISHLTGFGRMSDVIDRVETAAAQVACDYATRPYLGARASEPIPATAIPVPSQETGCLTGIDMALLQSTAERSGAVVHVSALPGAVVYLGSAVAYLEGAHSAEAVAGVRDAFRVENHRTYEQDPRLGFVALSEIASRALSTAANDPGTAVEVLNAIERVLTQVLTTEADGEVLYDQVRVPGTDFGDLLDDALRPIARDGAGTVEVGLRLQSVVGDLMLLATPEQAAALKRTSHDAQSRALAALTFAGDSEVLPSRR
jgi:uncharacterized membrane protein